MRLSSWSSMERMWATTPQLRMALFSFLSTCLNSSIRTSTWEWVTKEKRSLCPGKSLCRGGWGMVLAIIKARDGAQTKPSNLNTGSLWGTLDLDVKSTAGPNSILGWNKTLNCLNNPKFGHHFWPRSHNDSDSNSSVAAPCIQWWLVQKYPQTVCFGYGNSHPFAPKSQPPATESNQNLLAVQGICYTAEQVWCSPSEESGNTHAYNSQFIIVITARLMETAILTALALMFKCIDTVNVGNSV